MRYRRGYRRRYRPYRRYRRGGARSKYSSKYGASSESNWFTKAMHYGGIAADLAKKIATVAAMVNSEMHIFQSNDTQVPITTGDITLLNPIEVGDGNANRTGATLRMKYLDMNLRFQQDATATSDTTVKWALVLDPNHNNESTPTWADVYTNNSPLSLRKKDNMRKYIVLKSGFTTLGIDDGTTNIPNQRVLHIYQPLDCRTRFTSSSTTGITSTDIENGALYLLISSSQATYGPATTVYWSIGFRDN